MGTAALALVLFGCSDDMSQCVSLRTQTFASAAQCKSAAPAMLMSHDALIADYPTVSAICMNPKKAASIRGTMQDLSKGWTPPRAASL